MPRACGTTTLLLVPKAVLSPQPAPDQQGMKSRRQHQASLVRQKLRYHKAQTVTVREGLRFLLAIWQIKDQQLCWCSPPPSWTASKIPEEKWTNFIEIRYKNHNKTQKSWSCQHRHHHRWRTRPISTELSSSYLNMSLGHYQVPQLTAPAISQQLLLKAWKRNLWHQTTAWDCSWTSKSREHRCLRTVLPLHQCLLKAQTKDEKHLLKSYCNES